MNVFKAIYEVEKNAWENPDEITLILIQETKNEYKKLTDDDKKLIKEKVKNDSEFRLDCAIQFAHDYFDVVADYFLDEHQSKKDSKIYSIIGLAKVLSNHNWHYSFKDIAANLLSAEDEWLEKNLELFGLQRALALKVQEKHSKQIQDEFLVDEVDDITVEKFYKELCEIVLKDVSNPKYFGIIEYWSKVCSGRLSNPTRRQQLVKAFKAVMPEKFNEFAEITKQGMKDGTEN